MKKNLDTVGARFNEVPRDLGNWFVISRVRYIEVQRTLDITNQFDKSLDTWLNHTSTVLV